VIYDEAWRVLKQPALLARMQSQWKLSRALGIANLMVIHRLSDLDAVGDANSESRNHALGLLADCSTKIIYAQERGEDVKTGAALGLSSTEVDQLSSLARGEGLWRMASVPLLCATSARRASWPCSTQTKGWDKTRGFSNSEAFVDGGSGWTNEHATRKRRPVPRTDFWCHHPLPLPRCWRLLSAFLSGHGLLMHFAWGAITAFAHAGDPSFA